MTNIALLALNLLFALLWMFMWGIFDIYALVMGLALGYLVVGLVAWGLGFRGYMARPFALLSFAVYFIRILIKANLQVAWEIVTPGHDMNPRIVRYPVTGLSPLQVTTLANSITLTPGTLSVDVSDDEQNLYVHCMYARDRAAAVRDLDELRDRILREVFDVEPPGGKRR